MCDCGSTPGCNITALTKGEKGDTGATGASAFVGFVSTTTQTLNAAYDLMSAAVVSPGNYIVMLQGQFISSLAADITSRLYIDAVSQVANDNYQQRDSLVSAEVTFTHNAKVTLLAGETVGFKIASTDLTSTIDNASLTLIKM